MSDEEGVPAFGLAEIEEVESAAPVLGDVAAGPRRCLCGSPRLGDSLMHREGGCLPIVTRRAVEAGYPVPLVTSRDEWDGVEGLPSAVAKQAEKARAALWSVRVQRSRGCAPHAVHGAPGALKWWYALRLRKGAAHAYAVYGAGASAGWKSIMLWGGGRFWFPYATVTELGDYLEYSGDMPEQWYTEIRSRVLAAEARRKATPKSASSGRKEGMS